MVLGPAMNIFPQFALVDSIFPGKGRQYYGQYLVGFEQHQKGVP